MKIIIQDEMNEKRASKLIVKFLGMSEEAEFDYLSGDTLHVGENPNSGYAYIYLEGQPSLSICLNLSDEFEIVYGSSLDGMEFFNDLEGIDSLSKLESVMNEVYNIEEQERGDNYSNYALNEAFVDAVVALGWWQ